MQNKVVIVGKGKQTPHFQTNQSSIHEVDDLGTLVNNVQNSCFQHSQQNTVKITPDNRPYQLSQRPFGSTSTNNYPHNLPTTVQQKYNYSYNTIQHHTPTQQSQYPNQTSFSKKLSISLNQAQRPWSGHNGPIVVQSLKQETQVNYQSNNFPSSTVSHQITISSQDLLDLLQKLEKGNLQRFCSKFGQKVRNNANISNKLAQLTFYFKHQSQFLKKAKEIITGALDSRIMYMVDVFLFFQQIPDILNKVALRLIDIFKLQFNQNQLKGNIHQKVLKSLKLALFKLQEVQKDNTRNIKSQSNLKRQLQKKNEQIQKLKKQVQQQKNNQIAQIDSKQLMSEQLSNWVKQSQKLKIQVFELESKISAYQKKVKKIQEQKLMLRKQLEILTLNKSNTKSNIFQPNFQNEQKVRQLESVSIRLTTENDQLKQKLKTQEFFTKDNQSLIVKQNNYLKNTIKSLQQTIEQHQSSFSSQRSNTSHRIKTLQQKIHQLQHQLSKKPQVVQSQQNYNQFLQSSYLLAYNDVQLKSNLFHLIKNFKGSKPLQFKLLYRFDKLIQSNFHLFIDNKPNLLLIIRLQSDIVIGGFSPEGLRKQNQYSTGFLFSLTFNKAYYLYHGQKCLTYDQYFCVFGNSEIRLRLGQDKIYSSLGINNRFFDSGHDSHIQFLYGINSSDHPLDRQVKIKGYEFYEVNFLI